ncbi:hypothetical protein Droror1_Dr00023393 [Drosera rotundifolia]
MNGAGLNLREVDLVYSMMSFRVLTFGKSDLGADLGFKFSSGVFDGVEGRYGDAHGVTRKLKDVFLWLIQISKLGESIGRSSIKSFIQICKSGNVLEEEVVCDHSFYEHKSLAKADLLWLQIGDCPLMDFGGEVFRCLILSWCCKVLQGDAQCREESLGDARCCKVLQGAVRCCKVIARCREESLGDARCCKVMRGVTRCYEVLEELRGVSRCCEVF